MRRREALGFYPLRDLRRQPEDGLWVATGPDPVLALGPAAAVAALSGATVRVRCRLDGAPPVLAVTADGEDAARRYRRLWRSFAWSVAATATANLQGQGPMLLVGLLAGPAAYAPIAAVLVLFSPLRLLGTVVVNLTQPEMARLIAAGEARRLRLVAAAGSAVLTAACLAYGAALLLLAGPIEAHLFAGHFAREPFALIVALVFATVTLTMLYAGPKTLLETRRGFRSLAAMALASAGLGMSLVAALVVLVAPAWSMAGVAASEIVVLIWCWRSVLHGREAAPVARPDPIHGLVPSLPRRL